MKRRFTGDAMRHETDNSAANEIDRRQMLKSTAVGLAAAVIAGQAGAQEQTGGAQVRAESFAQSHQPKPLPFNSASLNGLSQRLIDSHWQNNYSGSVRALNETKRRLADALADRDLPPYIYNDLKREHLMRTGSVVLHELYFENLGGNGRADEGARSWLAGGFGQFDRWEAEFRRIANGLGGGSGWVILGFNRQFGTVENYWMADHMHSPAMTVPLLVMDMCEHSYHMDFGAAAGQYVDAFFNNLNWETVLARIEALNTLGGAA
jgi:Fe-Mn family superoxide dismutase